MIYNLFLHIKVKRFEAIEQRKVEQRLYQKESFKEADQALLKAYQSLSPYKISKEYLKEQKAPEIFTYGETPLTTMEGIVTECELTSSDTVIEMGAGRGRTSLFLAEYVGCKVISYEQILAFVENCIPSPNLTMLLGNMLEADFSKGTAIYLYGTLLNELEIQALCATLPKNVKIITVSYPLSEYSDKYVTRKTFSGRFPWGKTEVYWNERIG